MFLQLVAKAAAHAAAAAAAAVAEGRSGVWGMLEWWEGKNKLIENDLSV